MGKAEHGRIIFLDLDGVIADFVRAALEVHGARYEDFYKPGADGPTELSEALGLSANAFWKPLNTVAFWESIPKMPDADAIVEMCERHYGDQVIILSTPSLDPRCMVGKHRWLERHFPQFRRRFFFGPKKWKLAGPGRILIDDRYETCMKWRDGGGPFFCLPRPWNQLARHEDQLMELLEMMVEKKT